jgi:hypothetical protein
MIKKILRRNAKPDISLVFNYRTASHFFNKKPPRNPELPEANKGNEAAQNSCPLVAFVAFCQELRQSPGTGAA